MTNEPCGNLRDVWSLLALGEALRLERPGLFAQSPAGPAYGPWDADPERVAFAGRFVRAAPASHGLAGAAYARLAARELARPGSPRLPGAAALALVLLEGTGARFALQARDAQSFESIAAAARDLGVAPGRIALSRTAGFADLLESVRAPGSGAGQVLVFLDPPDACGTAGPADLDAWACFERLAARGVRTLLATSYHGPAAAARPHRRSHAAVLARARAALGTLAPGAAWCGAVHGAELERRPPPAERSLHGCALLAAHLAPATLATLRELGIRLAHALSTESFDAGALGALVYSEI